jgi:hypothetical protein
MKDFNTEIIEVGQRFTEFFVFLCKSLSYLNDLRVKTQPLNS